MQVKGVTQIINQQIISTQEEPVKCSFGIVNQTKLNYEKFTALQKKAISKLLQRPASDTSFITPKGKFRIHYTKTGIDAPGYDLNELAKAVDSSYNYEVNILGYPPPPKDSGEGGDDLYDIYIQNLSSEYGYTEFENPITNITYTSFMVIDNDFSGDNYHTHGIDGARVTVAHEMHHAIQIGNYIYRASDNYYYELTSTAMEEFVYNDINDYYYYMGSYFRNPQQTFNNTHNINNGYDLAIWNIYLKDRFGVDIIKRTWQLLPNERALQAISDAIQETGSSLKIEFNNFGIWTYFTDGRAVPNKYFKEAAKYPLLNPTIITSSINVNSEPVSNNFFQYNNFTPTNKDSVVTLVTNCDLQGALGSSITILPFTYTLSSQQINGGKKIGEGFYSKLESADANKIALLMESNVLTGYVSIEEIDYAYPQPFRYSQNSFLNFPASATESGSGEIYIYNISMNLVYSSHSNIIVTDKIVMQWNGLDSSNKKLGTGVYIYVTKCGDNIKKGKFVIYND